MARRTEPKRLFEEMAHIVIYNDDGKPHGGQSWCFSIKHTHNNALRRFNIPKVQLPIIQNEWDWAGCYRREKYIHPVHKWEITKSAYGG
jgi:hypothetical protein